jgi:hypothetical protein
MSRQIAGLRDSGWFVGGVAAMIALAIAAPGRAVRAPKRPERACPRNRADGFCLRRRPPCLPRRRPMKSIGAPLPVAGLGKAMLATPMGRHDNARSSRRPCRSDRPGATRCPGRRFRGLVGAGLLPPVEVARCATGVASTAHWPEPPLILYDHVNPRTRKAITC